MPQDKVETADAVFADVASGKAEGPAFPCSACGKETKVHHEPGARICSNKECRHVIRSF
jgi:hypothetical protein